MNLPDETPTIHITSTAYQKALTLCQEKRKQGLETTFYLLGPKKPPDSKAVFITKIIRAGNPVEKGAMTRADYGESAKAILPLLDKGLVVHGEGHHHLGLTGPSGGDLSTLRSIPEEIFPEYKCLVLTTFKSGKEPVMSCHAIKDSRVIEYRIEIVDDDKAPNPKEMRKAEQEEYQALIPEENLKTSLLICGLGSGGCTVAKQASKWGVERMTLLDPDTFEERNLFRHLADKNALDHPKASWMKKHLRRCGTATRISTSLEEITPDNRDLLLELVSNHDIIVNCTGHPVASQLISEACKQVEKSCIHAGVFQKGSGGFVFVQQNNRHSPCYSCLFNLTKLSITDDKETMEQLKEQYGFTDDQLNAQIGLWTDVTMVSSLQAKILLEQIKKHSTSEQEAPNLYILDNHLLNIKTFRTKQREECMVCHPPEENREEDSESPLDLKQLPINPIPEKKEEQTHDS